MGLISFTSNVTDHSNSEGFQWEFHCDHCGNGYMTQFQASKVGMAGGFLRAAGSLFGGVFDRAADAGDRMKDAFRGKARDEAFAKAVAEAKPAFKQCSRCGKWVCPEHCWNHERGLCEQCAPDLNEEAAAVQAQVAREQLWEKARASDQTGGVDLTTAQKVGCPHCGAKVQGGKFCPECGKSLAATLACRGCGAQIKAGTKFCPECGAKAAG